MELRIIHFYPDLMSLYGSYANVSVLKRMLETLGHTVTVESVHPGESANLSNADFLFMGAGTERAQKAALADFLLHYGNDVRELAANGTPMLFAGNSMELLGKSITDAEGKEYDGIGLASFTSLQGKRRIVEDVYGQTDLYAEPIVGFMNKCSLISGVETPLITSMAMGFGNEAKCGPEGFHGNNVFASQLTGPILAKNPRLLEAVIAAIYAHRGEALPAELPRDEYAEAGFAVTAEQLKLRCQ